jgi:hypothetical protein
VFADVAVAVVEAESMYMGIDLNNEYIEAASSTCAFSVGKLLQRCIRMSTCNVDALCVYLECAITSVSVLVDEAALGRHNQALH